MRSNIIQMLLNASSGKGGSSPGQPSSDWTIVHLLGKYGIYERLVYIINKDAKYLRATNVMFRVI